MQRLWAPWRMPYLKDGNKAEGCFLCEKAASNEDAANYVVYRGDHAYILLNTYPYSNGHLLVAPYQHAAILQDMDDATLYELIKLIEKGTALLARAMHPQGFNVGLNIGKAAGAGIADHIHAHIVPRWIGDTNFLTVVGETRTIPEMLDETYRRLQTALAAEGEGAD